MVSIRYLFRKLEKDMTTTRSDWHPDFNRETFSRVPPCKGKISAFQDWEYQQTMDSYHFPQGQVLHLSLGAET